MIIPAGSVAHNSLPPHLPQPDQALHVAPSEIERLQLAHDFSGWTLIVFVVLATLFAFGADSFDDWLCAMMIALATFYSVYVWSRGWVLGVPILPVYALACLVYYGAPFVTGHPVIELYDPPEKMFAAGTVSIVLVISTSIWAWIGRVVPRQVRIVRQIQPGSTDRVLLACLAGACLYQLNAIFWFVNIPGELWGVLRAVLYTLGLVAAFALANQLGAGLLGSVAAYLFLGMLALFMILNALTFYLYTAMEIGIFALFGYFLGGGRVPWKTIALTCMIFAVLHAGKGDMRVRYWGDGADFAPESATSAGKIVEWVEFGVANLLREPEGSGDPAPLIQRASLLQMVLKAETETPVFVPYLDGSTYLPIPFLLVPRMLWPERPNVQETLVQLNMHYGLLTRESSETTSIGWGMIAEAYANFGTLGCIALGILLGVFLGVTQRMCGRYPVLSARGLAGLIVLTGMLRIEAPMALFLSTLLQSFFPLLLLTWTVMRPSQTTA